MKTPDGCSEGASEHNGLFFTKQASDFLLNQVVKMRYVMSNEPINIDLIVSILSIFASISSIVFYLLGFYVFIRQLEVLIHQLKDYRPPVPPPKPFPPWYKNPGIIVPLFFITLALATTANATERGQDNLIECDFPDPIDRTLPDITTPSANMSQEVSEKFNSLKKKKVTAELTCFADQRTPIIEGTRYRSENFDVVYHMGDASELLEMSFEQGTKLTSNVQIALLRCQRMQETIETVTPNKDIKYTFRIVISNRRKVDILAY